MTLFWPFFWTKMGKKWYFYRPAFNKSVQKGGPKRGSKNGSKNGHFTPFCSQTLPKIGQFQKSALLKTGSFWPLLTPFWDPLFGTLVNFHGQKRSILTMRVKKGVQKGGPKRGPKRGILTTFWDISGRLGSENGSKKGHFDPFWHRNRPENGSKHA